MLETPLTRPNPLPLTCTLTTCNLHNSIPLTVAKHPQPLPNTPNPAYPLPLTCLTTDARRVRNRVSASSAARAPQPTITLIRSSRWPLVSHAEAGSAMGATSG
jgi:hypothetical protein